MLTYNSVSSAPLQYRVVDTAPGIYTVNQTGSGQGAILNQNSSVNSVANPESVGNVIQIFATGEGVTIPPGVNGAISPNRLPLPVPAKPVTVTIDGRTLAASDVTYAGEAPGLISGVLQVNARIPAGTRSGAVAVTIQVGGVSSQSNVTVNVR